jgi:hypothetical protein
VRASVKQQTYQRRVASKNGILKRRRARFGVVRVDVGAMPEQKGGDVEISLPCGIQ